MTEAMDPIHKQCNIIYSIVGFTHNGTAPLVAEIVERNFNVLPVFNICALLI